MTEAIGPGDWVECVGGPGSATPAIILRGIWKRRYPYLVSAVGMLGPHPWVLIKDMPHPGDIDPIYRFSGGWDARSFRPISSDITAIENLLAQPIPADILAEIDA